MAEVIELLTTMPEGPGFNPSGVKSLVMEFVNVYHISLSYVIITFD